MVDGGVQHPVLLHPLPMLLGDPVVRLDQAHGGDPAQTHHDFGLDQLHLLPEVADAGVLLRVQRVPVLGRAALDDVGDVEVLLPAQAHQAQHLV